MRPFIEKGYREMQYVAEVAGREIIVDVGPWGARVDGRQVAGPLTRDVTGGGETTLTVSGRVRVGVTRLDDEWSVNLEGETQRVRVIDTLRHGVQAVAGVGGAKSRDEVVKAPMPGLVLRMEVAVGDVVAAGQGLVVLEAMKMENEICATGAGVVKAIHVEAGSPVERGAKLVEIGPAAAS